MSKRRTFTPKFKAERVLEILTGVKSQAEICREHQIKAQVIGRWKTTFLENASQLFEQGQPCGQEEGHIEELERMVGRLTMELQVAKKASSILQSHLSTNEK